MPGTRKLGKTTDQRMAMLRQQVTDFLDTGRMETTYTRAKEIGAMAAALLCERIRTPDQPLRRVYVQSAPVPGASIR